MSFWVALHNGQPCAIVAEVNNTFGHRHCYFCAHDNFRPIEKTDTIMAEKLMHVSPFQKVEGQYSFNFDISDSFISIRISYRNGGEGVLATLNGLPMDDESDDFSSAELAVFDAIAWI